MNALEMTGVSVRYNGSPIVDGINLVAARGEWLGVIGPNGAGKSTVLNAVAGAIGYEGTIVIDDQRTDKIHRRTLARRVALVPQHPWIPPGVPLIDYVLLGRTPHIGYLGSETADDLAVTAAVIDRIGLSGFERRTMESLSGGELQRSVIARALVQEAPLLLLDEPTTSLDIGRQQEVLELIDDLRHDGLTVISAMHDLTIAGQFVDRVVMLNSGRVVAMGPPGEVLRPGIISQHYKADVDVIETAEGTVIVPRRRRSAQERVVPKSTPTA